MSRILEGKFTREDGKVYDRGLAINLGNSPKVDHVLNLHGMVFPIGSMEGNLALSYHQPVIFGANCKKNKEGILVADSLELDEERINYMKRVAGTIVRVSGQRGDNVFLDVVLPRYHDQFGLDFWYKNDKGERTHFPDMYLRVSWHRFRENPDYSGEWADFKDCVGLKIRGELNVLDFKKEDPNSKKKDCLTLFFPSIILPN